MGVSYGKWGKDQTEGIQGPTQWTTAADTFIYPGFC